MTKFSGINPSTAPDPSDYLIGVTAGNADFRSTIQNVAPALLQNLQLPRNLLINGNFDFWQRGTTFTTPNSALYTADRFYQIQKANAAWTFTQDSTTAPAGARYSLKAANVTANNQAAIIQVLENPDTVPLRGQTVSLSFWAKTQSLQISNLRATVLQWAGTVDSVTRGAVTTWNSAGSDPTWATNWTAAKAGSGLALTNSWQQFKVENIPINSSLNNMAVIIWVDDSVITAADTFWVSQVQLNIGTRASVFNPKLYTDEYMDCLRYYTIIRDTNQDYSMFATGFVTGINFQIALPVPLRTTPTLTVANLGHRFGGADYTMSSPSVLNMTSQGLSIIATSSGAPSNGNVTGVWTNLGGKFYVDAEL